MKKIIVAMLAIASSMVFGGNVCTWTGGSMSAPNDWTDAANWDGGVKPVFGNGDTVVIPNDKVATLCASDAASCKLVEEGGLAIIKMIGLPGDAGVTKTGTLVVTVDENDDDLTIYCRTLGYRTADAASSNASCGQVVKRGAGALRLNPESADDYYTSFTVEEGDLYLPQEASNHSNYRNICVSNNATLHLPATTGAKWQMRVSGVFEGEGVITNSHANGYTDIPIYVYGTSEFGGKLTNVRLFASKGGHLDLTGTESTMTTAPTVNYGLGYAGNSVLGVKKFGRRGQPSSVGVADAVVFGQDSGVIRYIGETDESTDKYIYWQYPKIQMNFLDGGAHGGLKFTADSKWEDWTNIAGSMGMKSLGLCGEGTVGTNEMAGKVEATVVGENTCRMHIVKSGASVWRFRDNAKRDGIGGIDVKEGTLQFDTLSEKGVMCALGTAVDCHTNYWGDYDVNAKVDYAFLLGSEAAQGALEYTGEGNIECSTRPIALTGKGGKLLNSTSSSFRFGGVAPVPGSATASTLTLGGSGVNGNQIAAVTDTAAAPISIEKEGSGTWEADSTCAFRGKVIASGGRLLGKEGKRYTWFRLNIKDVITNEGSTEMSGLSLMKFFLYNNKGVRQNANLTYRNELDTTKLEPGETVATLFQSNKDKAIDPTLLFSDDITGNGFVPWPVLDPMDETGQKWLRVYVRLPADADPVVAYDLVTRYKSNSGNYSRNVKTYTLEGSTDGINWYELDSIADTTDPNSPMRVNPNQEFSYYSDFAQLDADKLDVRVKKDGTPCGPSIASCKPGGRAAFDDISGVVLTGGTVAQEDASTPIDDLTVDAVKGGTLDNFTFAVTGMLDVLNLPKGASTELPIDFVNIPSEEIAKLANWSLKVGGVEKSTKSIVIRNGKVCIDSSGLMLIVR